MPRDPEKYDWMSDNRREHIRASTVAWVVFIGMLIAVCILFQ